MNISETCIRRPVLTTLMTASLIVFGVFAYRLLPVAALPAVDFPTIQITATLPGASPETMAASVASPIERQLSTISGISSMTSSSSLGTTQITIQFDLGRNIDGAALDVQTALAIAQRRLPIEMTTPPLLPQGQSGRLPGAVHQPELGRRCRCRQSTITPRSRCWRSRFRNCRAWHRCWSTARRNLPCASRSIRSPRPRATSRLKTSGALSPRPIRPTPVGTLHGPKQNVDAASPPARCRKAADYSEVVVAYRNGAPVKLNEIARVIDSVENDKIASWFNDERAIVLAIQRQPDANTVAVVDLVRSKLPQLRAQVPPVDPDAAAVRPLDLDPRGGQRRAGNPGDRDRARHHGDLPVPAQSVGDDHSGAGGAGLAGRHLRGDVCARLLHQQYDAAGADPVGRLRGRRRHRDAGKHRPPHRGRHAAVRGGAQGLARDRLHHRLDHVLADRRVHSGAVDGRHGRPRVPRIRGHDRGRDHRLRLRVADADADAVRARARAP